ncbi:MAG: 4a-hydroxytetrahydrobiopterin dehydratase [Candidatus Anammoxibacter sp.]
MNAPDKKCAPCEGGIPALTQAQIDKNLSSINGWQQDGKKIKKLFKFKNFKEALTFVNLVGGVAETEKHHPDIYLAYGKVEIVIWTHAINGLSENDFILAGKIDGIN